MIPATQEVEIRRITVSCQQGQKISKTPSQQIAGYLSSSYMESINRRITVQASQTKHKILSQK
jgi:hypothetical protein